MFLVPIALIVVVINLVQSIGLVAQSSVFTDIILDGVINKLQCSMFCVTRDMVQNRVPACDITSILSMKWHLSFVKYLLI